MELRLDHYGNKAISLIQENFSRPAQLLRVATGYFSFKGWNKLLEFLSCDEVRILIGFDDNFRQLFREHIVDSIMTDLRKWHDQERRRVIQRIANSMEAGKFRVVKYDGIEELTLRSTQNDHTKVYILDSDIVLAGSVNLTYSGLLVNKENLTAVNDPVRMRIYIEGFQQNWSSNEAYDVTQEILERLQRWLQMVNPFDIYLKSIAMFATESEKHRVKPSYKHPNEYQLDVVNQMERQLEKYSGCILIASTGLGKTVMATHTALRLYSKDLMDHVMVFAPVATHRDWEQTLGSAGLRNQIFTRNLLDRPADKSNGALEDLQLALEQVDDRTLIVLDEAQYFANRNRQPRRGRNNKFIAGERESYIRIKDAVKKGASIIMMTATPFVKRPSDINNQLDLLPHTGEPSLQNNKGQLMLLFGDEENVSRKWSVSNTERFFDEFVKLPISTIITTAYVAKRYCTHDPEKGEYLDFPDGRRYLPQVTHYRVRMPLELTEEMDNIFKQGTLSHDTFHFRDRDLRRRRSRRSIEQRSIVDWMSSPEALIRTLDKASRDGWEDKIPFTHDRATRARRLKPVIAKLKNLRKTGGLKFHALMQILAVAIKDNCKVIIFVEALPTAGYLEKMLQTHESDWRVASTVRYDEKEDVYRTKPKREARRILNHFAPIANADKLHSSAEVEPYDILITTDAFGAGINLQDASVVINYDLAWTPDTIIQRAGRVLRFWKDPRKVSVYTFAPEIQSEVMGQAIERVMNRYQSLFEKAKDAVRFSEYFFLLQESGNYQFFGDLSEITIENLGPITTDNLEEEREVSPMLHRRIELRDYKDHVATLPEDLISALEKDGVTTSHLYMLVRVHGRPLLILYDIEAQRVFNKSDDYILDFIRCAPFEPPALIDSEKIEQYAAECIARWCAMKKLSPDDVERICTMLIVPKGKAGLLM